MSTKLRFILKRQFMNPQKQGVLVNFVIHRHLLVIIINEKSQEIIINVHDMFDFGSNIMQELGSIS